MTDAELETRARRGYEAECRFHGMELVQYHPDCNTGKKWLLIARAVLGNQSMTDAELEARARRAYEAADCTLVWADVKEKYLRIVRAVLEDPPADPFEA